MKALHIDPAARRVEVIDLDPEDFDGLKARLGAEYLASTTLDDELIAFTDDFAIIKIQPEFTLYSEAHRNRISLQGEAYIFAANEADECWVDVTEEHVKRIDAIFYDED